MLGDGFGENGVVVEDHGVYLPAKARAGSAAPGFRKASRLTMRGNRRGTVSKVAARVHRFQDIESTGVMLRGGKLAYVVDAVVVVSRR